MNRNLKCSFRKPAYFWPHMRRGAESTASNKHCSAPLPSLNGAFPQSLHEAAHLAAQCHTRLKTCWRVKTRGLQFSLLHAGLHEGASLHLGCMQLPNFSLTQLAAGKKHSCYHGLHLLLSHDSSYFTEGDIQHLPHHVTNSVRDESGRLVGRDFTVKWINSTVVVPPYEASLWFNQAIWSCITFTSIIIL